MIGNGSDDYLEGGLGDDLLYGGIGSDTYEFSKGHEQDSVNESLESRLTATDVVKFADVNFADAKFRMEGE